MINSKGFTLIELLVVVAILGLLSSIMLVAINNSRAKARDAKRKADLAQINKALQLFFNEKQRYPANYVNFIECEYENMPGSTQAYRSSMQELVDAKLLSSIPKGPTAKDYCYSNYVVNGIRGALVATVLETEPPSASGTPPSCRPWPSNLPVFCNQSVSSFYCLCSN